MHRFPLAGLARRLIPVLALAAASAAHAEYFWLDRDAAGARLHAGELARPRAELPPVDDASLLSADGKAAALEAPDGPLPLPGGDGDLRFTASRPGDKTLTIYHARFGRQETRAVSDLELVPTTAGGKVFRLHWKGTPVSASQVNVFTSAGWSRVLRPAADGTVEFDPAFPSLYVMEVSAKVNGAVTIDGKKYEEVIHVATLSFRVGN